MAELKFKFIGDDSDVRKKLAELAKLQAESGAAFGKAFQQGFKEAATVQERLKQVAEGTKGVTSATLDLAKAQKEADAKAARDAQLAYMETLRASRLEIQKQREEQARLKVAYDEGRISQQKYRIEAARFSLEERKKAAALREAKKEISNNSEYQKLNRALGALRTESKNLLAEMYRLETQGKKGSTAYQELANKARGVTAQTKVLDGALKKIDASLGLHQRNVGNYGSALDAISPHFSRLNSQLSMMGVNLTELAGSKNAFSELGNTILGVGKNIGAFLISPVGLIITGLTSLYALIRGNKGTVMEFNSGLLNVSKTTDISGAALDKLGDDVVGLSRKLQTVGTEKLLEYATVAGQLGVKGSQNIMAFTEALAKLETASDITGEKGGAEIARLLTLTDGGVQNVKDFGDEIVNLGNNFAATESEILSNATAIAQNTGLYKVGRQDVLAYATATKAVGLEAEVVGSAMFRTLAQIEKYSGGVKGSEKILALLGKTQAELTKQFKTDSASVFNDLIAALNKIDREGGNVTATLNQLGLNNVRDIRVLGTLASSGYGQLEQAMLDVRDAAGSLDQEFNTAAGKLENQTKRISIAWNNLVLDIENGTGALGKSAVWLSGVFADALDRISKMVAPTGWNEFAASLTNFQAADVIREINIAVEESGKAMQSAMDIDLFKANSDKITETMDILVSAQNQATKSLDLYKKSIESGLLTDKGRTSINELESLLNRLSSKINQVSMFVPATKAGGTGTATGGNTLSEAELKAQARAHETMVNAQRAMQAKIDEMNQSAKRKFLKDGEEDVQAIKDKYQKLTEEAVRFNSNPKNKIKVDMSGLAASESSELGEATFKQATVELKKELDEQLRLYNDFEALRKSTSKKFAEERYKEQLPLILGYEKKLQAEIAKLAGKDRSKEEEKRFKQLNDDQKKFNEAKLKEEETAASRVYNLTLTYDDKMRKVQDQYQKDVEELGIKANAENLKILADGRKAEEKALQKSLVESLDSYKYYFENIAELSGEKLNQAITALRLDLDKLLKKHPELKAFIDKINTGLNTDITAKTAQDFREMGSSLLFMADATRDFASGLSDALRTAGDLANQIFNIKNDMSAFTKFKADGNMLGQVSSGLGMVGAAVTIGNVLNNFFNRETARDRQRVHSAELQLKATDSLTRAIERQIQAAQEAYGTKKIEEYTKAISESNKAIDEGSKALKDRYAFTGDAELDKVIEKMNKGEKLKGNSLFDFWKDSEKDLGKIIERSKKTLIADVEELQKLLDNGKLDDQTAKIAQNFIDAHHAIKDAENAMREFRTGANFEGLADDFVKALTAEKPFESLGETFEETIKKALLNSFKSDAFTKSMQGFYDEFDIAVKEGLTKDSIALLKKTWDQMGAEQKAFFDEMEVITGISFTKIIQNIGISLESVQDQFAALFASGTADAEAFGKSFEDIMKAVILNSFQVNFVKDAMAGFYQRITDLTESGNDLTEAEITLLRTQYESIVAEGQSRFAQLEKVTGLSFAVKEEIAEIEKEIDKVFSGFGDSIITSLTKPFEQAGDAFEDIMKKAILSTFRDGVLANELDGFYQMYAEMIEGGAQLSVAQVDQLRAKYEEIVSKGKATIEELEQMTGIALKEIEEIDKNLREKLTGSTLDGITDSIVNMFAEGKTAGEDFANNFEDLMKKAILNIFRTQSLAKELESFYDSFASYAEKGEQLSAADIAALRVEYDKMMAGAESRFKELQAITGIVFEVKEEVQKIVEIAKDTIVGITFESFADGIVDLLSRGTASVQDFADNFEQVMRNAILNTFKTKTLAREMEAFYDEFYRVTAQGGLTDQKLDQLKVMYDAMIKKGREEMDKLSQITGVDLSTSASSSGKAGAIRREITEETGGKIEALGRSQFEVSKSLLLLQEKQWAIANNFNRIGIERLTAIQKNTLRTADNTQRLENIENHLAKLAGANGGIYSGRTF